MNSSQPMSVAVPISVDGALRGSGTVSDVNVASPGIVSPGTSPGILSTGNIAFVSGTSFVAELNGAAPGSGYDQINVTGTVDLGNATLVATLGTPATPGQVYTLIENDSNDAITGTFNSLAEGATVTIGATNLTISYKGGTGNDVALRVTPPQLTVQINDGSEPVLGAGWRLPGGGLHPRAIACSNALKC